MHAAIAPVARLFTGLPGTPTVVRMVPVGMGSCRNAEAQVPEAWIREPAGRSDQNTRHFYLGFYLDCALGLHPPSASLTQAGEAVQLWALVGSGTVTREQLREEMHDAEAGHRSTAESAAALAMAELPTEQVRAELAPVWERLRAGTLPVAELPGPRP